MIRLELEARELSVLCMKDGGDLVCGGGRGRVFKMRWSLSLQE